MDMPRTSSTAECGPALSTGYHAPRRRRQPTPSRIRAHRGPFTVSAHSDITRSMASSPHRLVVLLLISLSAGVVKSATDWIRSVTVTKRSETTKRRRPPKPFSRLTSCRQERHGLDPERDGDEKK